MTMRPDPDTVRAERQIRLAVVLPECDGLGLKHLVGAGLAWLETNHKAVNALNVFPVPDGDTGTNMLMTMQAAYKEIAASTENDVSRMAHAVAHGALMGARGNSGVILSQIWRGFARGLGSDATFTAAGLARAVQQASETAYRGVGKPVEGTILTVIKDTAAAAEGAAAGQDLRQMLTRLVDAAYASVARTPDLMPLLKQAGVVDSGGKGLAIIMEGMLRYLRGQPLDASVAPEVVALDLSAVGAALDAAEPGQEWEVVVDFRPRGVVHLPTLYSRMEELGTSIQVGEGDGLWRVHIHLLKVRRHSPIELAEELGTVVKVHMENLLAQMDGVAGVAEPLALYPVAAGQIGVVAVSPGPGLSRVLASLGTAAIVSGGQSMNPSTQDILQAIGELAAAGSVIVLPNNKNILLAAQQAAELSVKPVAIVPSRTVPQGLTAMQNFLPDGPTGDLETVRAKMERALNTVQSGEVTTASRTVELNGVAVAEGQIIGLHNGQIEVAGEAVPAVTLALLEKMGGANLGAISLYYGAEVTPAAAQALAAQVRAAYPNPDNVVEVLPGGQPYYHYIISAE